MVGRTIAWRLASPTIATLLLLAAPLTAVVPFAVATTTVASPLLVVSFSRPYAAVQAASLVAGANAPSGLAFGAKVDAVTVIGPLASLPDGRRRTPRVPAVLQT